MKKIIQIIIGNILMAFAFSTLILDNSIVAGGVSGISTVFHFYTGISISLCVGIINIALFIIGFCFLGKAFAMKTLISTFLFPILLEFFNQQSYLHGLLNDQLLICILGGFLLGLGIGLVLKAGGSTGGFDILALVVEKYFKVPVILLVNGIDATILVLQISFHSVPEIVYGIMTILITAYMMNYLLSSGKGCVQVLVMSKEIERMKMMILNDMDAGVTLLDGKSGFYGNDTEVVLTILPYRKLPDLKDKIKEIDEKAFIIVSHV